MVHFAPVPSVVFVQLFFAPHWFLLIGTKSHSLVSTGNEVGGCALRGLIWIFVPLPPRLGGMALATSRKTRDFKFQTTTLKNSSNTPASSLASKENAGANAGAYQPKTRRAGLCALSTSCKRPRGKGESYRQVPRDGEPALDLMRSDFIKPDTKHET